MENKTKEMFADALKTLMKTKNLSDVRVSELCEMCDANRRTFYYHFEDKYDLVSWIFSNDRENNMNVVPKFSAERMTYSFSKAMGEVDFRKKLYQDPGISNCFDFMVKRNIDHYHGQLKELYGRDLSDDELFSIKMLTYGELYMIRDWYLEDCKTPPEELTRRIIANFPQWIRDML